MAVFFISYKRNEPESEAFVHELKAFISGASSEHVAWSDSEIGPRQWKDEIEKWIRNSVGLIIVVTPAALGSQYITFEWAFAYGLEKAIIPLILIEPDSMHPRLGDFNHLDFTNGARPWGTLSSYLEQASAKNEVPDEIQRAIDDIHSGDAEGAIKRLELSEHPAAVRALVEFGLSSSIPSFRIAAGIALARKTDFQDRRALPGLYDALKSENVNVRTEAVNLIGLIGDLSSLEQLSDIFRNDSQWAPRLAVMKALGRINSPTPIPWLLKALPDEKNPKVAVAIAELLAKIGGGQERELFMDIVRDPVRYKVHDLRRTAALGLGKYDDVQVLDALEHALFNTSSNYVVDLAVCQALGNIKSTRAIKILEKAGKSRGGKIRSEIYAILKRARQ